MHQYGDLSVSRRLKFTGNPKLGDASISISDLRISDTGTYQCKVKKAPGVDMRKVTLVVMGEEDFPFFTGSTCSRSRCSHAQRMSCGWTHLPQSSFLKLFSSFTPKHV